MLSEALARDQALFDNVHYYSHDDAHAATLNDENLLKIIIEAAHERAVGIAPINHAPLQALCDCEAIALFDLPEATAYLRHLAESTATDAPWDTQSAIDHAQLVLARRGDPRWEKAKVEQELKRIGDFRWVSESSLEGLRSWPTQVVRQALIELIRLQDERRDIWLHVLLFFANKDDEKLLQESIPHVDPYLADEIRARVSI